MNLIEEWGRWASVTGYGLSYQSQWLMVMRSNIQMPINITYSISDDEAMKIDKAVAKLGEHNVVLWRVLCLHYLCRWSMRRIAKDYLTALEYPNGEKKVSEHTARSICSMAEGFVYGFLKNT